MHVLCIISALLIKPKSDELPIYSHPRHTSLSGGTRGLPMFTLSRVLLRTFLPFPWVPAYIAWVAAYSGWAANHPRAPSLTPSLSRMCLLPPLQPTCEQEFRRPPPSHRASSQGTETLGCAGWGSGAGRRRVPGTSFCLRACGFCWWQLCTCHAGGLRRCNARG